MDKAELPKERSGGRPGTGKGGRGEQSYGQRQSRKSKKKKNSNDNILTVSAAVTNELRKDEVWKPLLVGGDNLYTLDESCIGRTWEHDQKIFAEVTKFLWLSLDPIQKELDTTYILKPDFQRLGQCLVAVIKDVSLEEAQREMDQYFKDVIPSFLLVSQKMDFLMFTEALSNFASLYAPNEVAEGQAIWIAKVAF
eukprot:761032-Hanusia_phi.AAC.12